MAWSGTYDGATYISSIVVRFVPIIAARIACIRAASRSNQWSAVSYVRSCLIETRRCAAAHHACSQPWAVTSRCLETALPGLCCYCCLTGQADVTPGPLDTVTSPPKGYMRRIYCPSYSQCASIYLDRQASL